MVCELLLARSNKCFANPVALKHLHLLWLSRISASWRGLRNNVRSYSMTVGQLDISGIYPPITMAFDENESLSLKKLDENFAKWKDIPFKGYVVHGSNGEAVHLSTEERVEVVNHIKTSIPSEKLLIAGSGCESTITTIDMTSRMADCGADAALIVTPSFFKGKMSNLALANHFTKVADASPIPVILYSVPGNTGIDLDAEVVIKLAQHPNIIGFKDSGGDVAKLGYIVHRTQSLGFQVLAGSASFLLPALLMGCVGGICALANPLGKTICDLQLLYRKGDLKTAVQLQHRLIAPNTAVTKTYGVPGLKMAMDWLGYYGGPTRSPLQSLNEAETQKLRQVFQMSEFLK